MAILGKALVNPAKRVDLPALGNPTNPKSARHFNSRYIYLSYPINPWLTYLIPKCFLFPLPPLPPLATKQV